MSTILVTGGASGVGGAITRRLAAQSGNKVYFTYCRSADQAQVMVRDHPHATGIRCDFRETGDVAALLARLPEMDIDVLVNNALVSLTKRHFHKLNPDVFLESFQANVYPTLVITQQAIIEFRKKKCGKIITVLSSYLTNRPPVGLAEYVANKAYLESASKSWAAENASCNITANCVSPSFMQTALTSGVDTRILEEMVNAHPQGRLVTPAEVAEVVDFLIGSTRQINGVNLLINGGADVV